MFRQLQSPAAAVPSICAGGFHFRAAIFRSVRAKTPAFRGFLANVAADVSRL